MKQLNSECAVQRLHIFCLPVTFSPFRFLDTATEKQHFLPRRPIVEYRHMSMTTLRLVIAIQLYLQQRYRGRCMSATRGKNHISLVRLPSRQ